MGSPIGWLSGFMGGIFDWVLEVIYLFPLSFKSFAYYGPFEHDGCGRVLAKQPIHGLHSQPVLSIWNILSLLKCPLHHCWLWWSTGMSFRDLLTIWSLAFTNQMNKTLLDTIMHHTPAGASTHSLLQYGQLKATGLFGRFSFELVKTWVFRRIPWLWLGEWQGQFPAPQWPWPRLWPWSCQNPSCSQLVCHASRHPADHHTL